MQSNSLETLTDEALLMRYRMGDQTGRAVLVSRYWSRCDRLLLQCGNPGDGLISDVKRASVFKAYLDAEESYVFGKGKSFRGFLLMVLNQEIIRAAALEARRRGAENNASLDEEIGGNTFHDVVADPCHTSDPHLAASSSMDMDKALDDVEKTVGKKGRKTMAMAVAGYKIREIAKILDCPTSTVNRCLKQGRERIKKKAS